MRTLFISIIMLSQMMVYAQRTEERSAQKMERMQAQKVAFFTNKLNLTVLEAEVFWPVYNEYNDKRQALKKSNSWKGQTQELTDDEANKLLDDILDLKEKDFAIQKEYLYKFKEVLPSQKVVRLYKLERRFKDEIIRNIEDRLKQRRNNKR